jgi:hypothetical protein
MLLCHEAFSGDQVIGLRSLAKRALGGTGNSSNWWLWRTPEFVNYNTSTALTIPAVARAIRLVSGDASRLPVSVQQRAGESWETVEGERTAELLNRSPNPELSANEWRAWLFRDLLVYGNHRSPTTLPAVDRSALLKFCMCGSTGILHSGVLPRSSSTAAYSKESLRSIQQLNEPSPARWARWL